MLYLFVDGVAERLHLGQLREAVLPAWGINESGIKVLLGLATSCAVSKLAISMIRCCSPPTGRRA